MKGVYGIWPVLSQRRSIKIIQTVVRRRLPAYISINTASGSDDDVFREGAFPSPAAVMSTNPAGVELLNFAILPYDQTPYWP